MRRILRTYRDAFEGLPREVWWLAAVTLVNRSGTMVLPFLVLYLTRERGYGIDEAGLFLALYGLGSIGGTLLGGKLVDRIGSKPVQVASLVATGLTLFLLAFLRSPYLLGATITLLAAVTEAFRPANSSAVAAATSDELRARAYGLQRLAINLGFSLGPALGGLLAQVDYTLLFWVDGATCLAAAGLLAATVRAHPAPSRAQRDEAVRSGRSPWRDRTFLVFFLLIFPQGLVFFQVQGTLVYFLRDERGFSEGAIGLLMAINTLLIVAFEMVLIRRVERRDPLLVIALASLLYGVGYGLLPYGVGFAFVAGTIAVWTLGEMLGVPMMTHFTASRADASNRGRYMGLFGMSFAGAQLLAPLLGTWTYDAWGSTWVWTGCFALCTASAVGLVALSRSARPVEVA
ncbi:MAG: MFS transporter [Planctomycetota bacterium]